MTDSQASESALFAEKQRRVEELADEYLERLLAGETPDRQALVAAHPDLAELLEPRLALVELIHRVAKNPAGATASIAGPGEAAERALRMKCPHCGNAIQLVEAEQREVTCSGCGSSFHVDARATASYDPAGIPRKIGKFDVLEQLGRGTFGAVYKARDPELQRLVAIKVPRAGSFGTPEEEERFLREARATAQLSHSGIVPVLEIAHDRGVPYIVSEFVDGLTLADVLTARRPGFRESAELMAAVADALDYAHKRKIVHRDIKPSNLILDPAGRPHVTDFGLARRGEGEITVTLDGQILGTPAYMSPEQAAGDQQHVDARSDVYSLGVILYELLTGELPFRGNQRMLLHQVLHDEPRPPRSLNDRVPRDLETICLKAMAKTPGRRYESSAEMADDLRRFLNGEAIRARPVGRAEKLARWARRNPVVATLTGVVALLLVAVTAVAVSFAFFQRQSNQNLSQANEDLSDAKKTAERNQRDAEVRAASSRVDLDLKHCEDGPIEYGVLRLARTLRDLPPHAIALRQCVEMNLLAWAQEIRPLGPTFQYDGAETIWQLSPDGLTVLTGGADGTARLWDTFTGDVRATLRGHRGGIISVDFSQNGLVAMTIGEDRTVRFWDTSTGKARGATAEHATTIQTVWLSPDGGRLLTICQRESRIPTAAQSANLWDTATGQHIGTLAGHAGSVIAAAFSPDGRTLITGGEDKTARLWSADSGRQIATLQGIMGPVIGVGFSPDAQVIATLERAEGLISCLRWWDARQLLQIGPTCFSNVDGGNVFRVIQRDVAIAPERIGMGGDSRTALFIQGLERAIEIPVWDPSNWRADDDNVFDPLGGNYDRKSGKRRGLPATRAFSPGLAPFAAEGRFIGLNLRGSNFQNPNTLIDLRTEKQIGNAMDAKFVTGRKTFVCQHSWPAPPTYVPIFDKPLDVEVALLFAEVATCHELDPGGTSRPLDETTWDERRRELIRRLGQDSAPFPIRQLASDKWHWLRHHATQAQVNRDYEESIKYLDRLIAVEPTWQNYHRRGVEHLYTRPLEAARDWLEAARRAGNGYWHHPDLNVEFPGSMSKNVNMLMYELILPASRSPEEYQVGLQLAETLSHALPERRDYSIPVGIGLYRLGRYADALSNLEVWRGEWERIVVGLVGQYFLMGPSALVIRNGFTHPDHSQYEVRRMAFLAMSHYRLGHKDTAHAVLNDLRTLGDTPDFVFKRSVSEARGDVYKALVGEAETLIEGRPRADK